MAFLTIKTRTEEYKVNSSTEFAPNFVRHVMDQDEFLVFNESGEQIGYNSGRKSLLEWSIKHDDVDVDLVKRLLLRECERFL